MPFLLRNLLCKNISTMSIYMGIIYMYFILRNLCKDIYTMLLQMWNNELFNIWKLMAIPLLYFVLAF